MAHLERLTTAAQVRILERKREHDSALRELHYGLAVMWRGLRLILTALRHLLIPHPLL